MISRRAFLGMGAACAASALGAAPVGTRRKFRFRRNYAPHFGMFRHHAGSDPIDQIKFLSDQGFAALEDCGLMAKAFALQEEIGVELARRGMQMGVFVGLADFGRPTFAAAGSDARREVLRELSRAIDTARRVGSRFIAIVPGKRDPRTPLALQIRRATDTLQYCAEMCDQHEMRMLLEPIDHRGGSSRLFLRTAHQAAELCRIVGHPSCRYLFDVYQQAVNGEDLPHLLEQTGDVLGYVQLADSPRRKEPGTGEIDFGGLFTALDSLGYRGILGMEHGNAEPGLDGERTVLQAYARLDRMA